MSPIDVKKILARVEEEGFEKVWRESTKMLPESKNKTKQVPKGRGTPHLLYELTQKMRNNFFFLLFRNRVF